MLDELHGGPDTGVLNFDTIIVLHLPAGGGAAVAFSIPRDSYVDIPGYRRDKINAAYPAVKAIAEQELVADGAQDRREISAEAGARGRTALIGAVEDLNGLTIDRYAEVNLVGFATLTKAIGGVTVCLSRRRPATGCPARASPRECRRSKGPPRSRSSGNATACRRVTCRGSVASKVSLAATADKLLSAGTLTDPSALGRCSRSPSSPW